MPSHTPNKLLAVTRAWRDQQPDRRRSFPVRLTEIPVEVRLTAARSIDGTADERADVLRAALFPSDTIYWIAA